MQKIHQNVKNLQLLMLLMCFAKLQSASAACSDTQWTCDDGSCIAEHLRCDGKVDCVDRSDEIAENCIQNYNNCQEFAFKCSYGACITGLYRCNGVKDCADNSDESPCSIKDNDHWRGQCRADEMECLRSKECISVYKICDGQRDCSDGTDESIDVCAGYACPKIGFHCGYGGCVSGNAKCNGTTECADGSDEAWELCGTPRKAPTITRVTPTKPTTKPTPSRPTPSRPTPSRPTPSRPTSTTTPSPDYDGSGCQIPEDLVNLRFKLHPMNKTIVAGSWLEDSETVHVECLNKASIRGSPSLLCVDGKFDSDFPSCFNYCDGNLVQGLSTRYQCYDPQGRYIEERLCKTRIPPGTQIDVSCAPGFKSTTPGKERQIIHCLADGTFDRKREQCVQDCGHPLPSYVPLIKAGIPVKPSSVPWHVAIYELDGGKYTYICTGSIISPSIVISAAHCFWDNAKLFRRQVDPYQLVAGKYNRAYVSNSDGMPQVRGVESIYISDNFRGKQNNNFADIALIKMKSPLVYNENISAICMPIRSGVGGKDFVRSNLRGSVTGYGRNNTLERVEMITRDYYRCQDEPEGALLTEDKFCLYNDHEASICRGDSGGGFFEKLSETFQLLGIISYTPSTENDCARDGFVGVTNVRYMTNDLFVILRDEMAKDTSLY